MSTPEGRWHLRGACRGRSVDEFYQEGQGLAAKAVCATCPVLAECLAHAVDTAESFGIWGGLGQSGRREFRLARMSSPHRDPRPVKGCACQWCRDLRAHLARLKSGHHGSAPAGVKLRVIPRFKAGATHGARQTYNRGCRCSPCRWSASALGQVMARVGVHVPDFWAEHSGTGDYDEARRPADLAALEVGVDIMAAMLATVGRYDVRDALRERGLRSAVFKVKQADAA